jgi:hypothetical protein
MMTFVLAAAVLVGALYVGAALEGVATEAPPGVVASHVLAAGLLATYHTAPGALSDRRREPVTPKAGQERAVTVFESELTTGLLASDGESGSNV